MTEAKRLDEMTEDEQRLLDDAKSGRIPEDDFGAAEHDETEALKAVEPEDDGDVDGAPPAWFQAPPGWKPPAGKRVTYMRFRASWTDTPKKGDRQCALWNLTDADEKLAVGRARGDSNLVIGEMARQMVRVVDGCTADWVGSGPGSMKVWWREIGAKGRQVLKNHYLQTHAMTSVESADFFANCVAVRVAAG